MWSLSIGMPEQNIIIICRNTIKALKTIAATYLNIDPLHNSKFISKFADELYNDAKDGNKILVYGNSYGGAIANKVAVELSKKKDISSLDISIATFGSIYIAKFIPNVNLLNYIHLGDVAYKLNKIQDDSYNDLNKELKSDTGDI